MSHANIITQVSPETPTRAQQVAIDDGDIDMTSLINLNIRGVAFQITRDELMNLPESILLCLFPNGVFVDVNGDAITNLTENDVVYVNFDPECFQYIVQRFKEAAAKLPSNTQTQVYDAYQTPDADVLSEKPAIIVLREDLDYYIIPPTGGIGEEGIRSIKRAAGSHLVNRTKVFEGLGYGVNKQLGPAEEHLLDMLCSSGFSVESEWGHRSSEPGKTVLTSLALVDLKSPQPEPEPEFQALEPATSNKPHSRRARLKELAENAARSASRSVSRNRSRSRQRQTSSKLLLFWRKPARKCWWANDVVELSVPVVGNEEITVTLHIRRVWTLELAVMGVH